MRTGELWKKKVINSSFIKRVASLDCATNISFYVVIKFGELVYSFALYHLW